MIDGCGREIDHLRLSLTDRCNLACRYCVPDHRPYRTSAAGGINADFAFAVVRWLSRRHGIRYIRLTGGEPLLYGRLIPLIARLAALDALHGITLTTNAQALAGRAGGLRAAGLSRVNISLDTLDPERFSRLTRGGVLRHTLRGIEAAIGASLTPVKINVVVQRGVNHDELPRLARWGLARGCVVRFLETMAIGAIGSEANQLLVPASEMLARLGEHFELRPAAQAEGQPATDYSATGADVSGVIGVIAWTTRPFCSSCRRLRMTATGRLIPCLHDRHAANLTDAWDGRRFDEAFADAMLATAVAAKPRVGPRNQTMTMVALGG